MEASLLIHLKIIVYILLQGFLTKEDALQAKVNQLVALEEDKRMEFIKFVYYQDKIRGSLIRNRHRENSRRETWF